MENDELVARCGWEKYEFGQQAENEKGYDISEFAEKFYGENVARCSNEKLACMKSLNNKIKRLQEEVLRDAGLVRRMDFIDLEDPIVKKSFTCLRMLNKLNRDYLDIAEKDAPEYAPTKLLLDKICNKVEDLE